MHYAVGGQSPDQGTGGTTRRRTVRARSQLVDADRSRRKLFAAPGDGVLRGSKQSPSNCAFVTAAMWFVCTSRRSSRPRCCCRACRSFLEVRPDTDVHINTVSGHVAVASCRSGSVHCRGHRARRTARPRLSQIVLTNIRAGVLADVVAAAADRHGAGPEQTYVDHSRSAS